jgi:hypothetical protein
MSHDREPEPKISRMSRLSDVSRNRRQASVFLSEVARHHCVHAADKLIKESSRLIEESKKLRAKAQELRKHRDLDSGQDD